MPTHYEYRVIPAPTMGQRADGVKGSQARFAHAVEGVMNQMAAEGWEYQRADTLPSEERQSLTNGVTAYRSLLIFRRPIELSDEGQALPDHHDHGDTDPAAEGQTVAFDDEEYAAADYAAETAAEFDAEADPALHGAAEARPARGTGGRIYSRPHLGSGASGVTRDLRRRAEHLLGGAKPRNA